MRRGALWTLSLWMLAASALPAGAVSARSWSASTGDEFALGTLDGSSIDEEGGVELAPPLETLWGPAEGIVWAVAPAGDSGAWVALSGPGRVLRVMRGEPAVTMYATPGESLVTAMTPDGEGGVLAGLSPEGRLVHIAESGEANPVAETEATFIWAVARDEQGAIWIGTGLPGRLLRVAASGRAETVFDAGEDPVRCIALLDGRGLVIGTGGRGRVVRVDGRGRPFVLLDAEEVEIVALAADATGTLFALAVNGQKQPSAAPAAPREEPEAAAGSMRVVVTAAAQNGDPGQEQEEPATEPPKPAAQRFKSPPGGALYRLEPDGMVRKIWETTTEMPFGLAVTAEGKLLVTTGDEGRVWLLDRDGRSSLLLRIPSNQASAVALGPGGAVLVGGTTDARVERIGAGPRAEGVYLTPAVDAGNVAEWGRVDWSAEVPRDAKLRLSARSGNSAEPDDTWSDWLQFPAGGDSAAAGLPASRWLQLRAEMVAAHGRSPRLTRVEVRYLPRNRAPSVTALSVEPPGVVWTRVPVQSSARTGPQVADDPVSRGLAAAMTRGGRAAGAIRKSYEAGARTITWTVEDPDEDRLRFSLDLRREGDGEWFPLAVDLEDEYHSWDSRAVPDGQYRIRLTADDSPDNPRGSFETIRRVTNAFRIDNSRPAIGEPEWERSSTGWRVRFAARDTGGAVAAAEYSVDGGEWKPLVPLDGVADSEEERFEIGIPARDPAPRGLGVRVADGSGNLAGAAWFIPAR